MAMSSHMLGRHVIASGMILVYFYGRLIALVDETGRMIWRDPAYSVALVEYLIECPSPNAYKWN
jgi:hypothetical protein